MIIPPTSFATRRSGVHGIGTRLIADGTAAGIGRRKAQHLVAKLGEPVAEAVRPGVMTLLDRNQAGIDEYRGLTIQAVG
jgi:hypothetical protein